MCVYCEGVLLLYYINKHIFVYICVVSARAVYNVYTNTTLLCASITGIYRGRLFKAKNVYMSSRAEGGGEAYNMRTLRAPLFIMFTV